MAVSGLLVLGALLVSGVPRAGAFNLDTEHYTRHGPPRGVRPSMFGFAVAAHRERGQPWVMVGAPEAQTRQPGVDRGGAVYRCDPTRDDDCEEVLFDRSGNNNDSSGHQIDTKSHQWFGATLSSAGEDGPFVACAPRYVSYAAKNARRDPVGTCFVSRNGFTDILEYAPCRTRNWGYHRQGSCQAGLGASVSKDGRRLFIGAPGSWYWQGQMHSINPTIRLPFMPPRYKDYGEGQLYSQSLDLRPSVLSTGESRAADDDSYLGYSVAVGDFNGSGEQGVAVGMPRGANLLGKVVLYSWDLQNIQNLTGEQLGGYFGYSMCAADVDGDGLDDLIVGAPMYTPVNNEGKYDVGRVYIIYQSSEEGRFVRVESRDGFLSKSRFGLSLAALGDINLDGFGDFAVGAPYDGITGRGVVYIFHGAAGGAREKPSQIIKAEDMGQNTLTTFGFSVAGGVDLDTNQYTDLVVGAYESDSAFLFRAKPVVKMTASILFGTDSKLISLDEKNCTLINRRKVACTTINYCLKYDGIGVDTAVDFDLQFILDAKKPNDPRLFFLNNEGRHVLNQTIPLVRDDMYCNSMQVYIVGNIRDKLTPIEAEIRYSMREERSSGASTRRRNPRSILHPILDQNVPNVQKDSVNIQKNCGPDNVCIPDLRLMATPSVDKYLLGSKERLNIDVIVQNTGEDAFETTYNLQLPGGVNYIKIERIDNAVTEIPVQCSPPTSYNNNTLKCDIGNPLPQGKLVHFKVLLEPFHKTGMAPSYDFFMEANSTNPEKNQSAADNQQSMSIGIWLETDLVVTGASHPMDLHYNMTNYRDTNWTHEADIGPQLVHLYGIRNNGPSTIEEAEIFLLWPYETLAGDSLMYVLEQPETTGNIRCELAEHVNDLDVQIDRKRKSYLDSSNSAMQGGLMTSEEKIVSGGGSSTTSGGNVVAGGAVSGGTTSGGAGGYSWSSSSSSKNFSSSSSGSGMRGSTEDHRKKIDEEERKFGVEAGDGSRIHIQRAQEAHTGTGQGGGSGQGQSAHRQWSSNTTGGTRVSGSQGNQRGQWASGEVAAGGTVNRWNRTYTSGGTGQNWGPATQGTQWSSSQNWGSQQGRGEGQQGGVRVNQQSWGQTGPQSGQQGGSQSSQQGGTQVWHQNSGVRDNQQGSGQQGWGQGNMQGSQQSWGQGEAQGGGSGQHGWANSGIQGGQQSGAQGGQNVWVAGAQDGQKVWMGGAQEGHINQMGAGSHATSGQGQGGQQWTWYERRPVGEVYNKSYTTSWNSTQVGAGPAVIHHSSKNTSAGLGADGTVKQTESSTEYYTVGAEGEAGSSFNKRLGESSNYDRSYHTSYTQGEGTAGTGAGGGPPGLQTEENAQGGSIRYGSGSYTSGGARRYDIGDRKYSSGYNVPSQGWGEGADSYASGGRHKWSTEETVNRDLINAGSATFHQESASAGNTFVGAVQRPNPMGAAAAGRGYRVNTWDLDTPQDRQTIGGQQGEGSESFGSSHQTQWSVADNAERGRDNVATDRPQEHFRWDRKAQEKRDAAAHEMEITADSRKKRDTVEQEVSPDVRERRQIIDRNEEQLAEATRCPGLRCARVRCVAGPLPTNHEIWLAVRARVNAQTLKKLMFDRTFNLTSVAVARVSRLPYLGMPLDRPPRSQQASTVLIPLAPPQPAEGIPLWAVVLAACAGAALLLLLVLALYKCGFFKRNRPSDAPERQPLNRNGYGHGDEQL